MQWIAGIRGQEIGRIPRVPERQIEIDHAVESMAGSNPLVQFLAFLLSESSAIISAVDCVRSPERRQCPAVDLYSCLVARLNDLLINCDQYIGGCADIS